MRPWKLISIIISFYCLELQAQCPAEAVVSTVIDTFCTGTRYSFGDTTIRNEGLYERSFVDINGCDSLVNLDLRETPNVSFDIVLDTLAPVCTNDSLGSIIIREVGKGVEPIVYSINNGPEQLSNVFSDLPPGSYQVYLRDRFGCEGRKNVQLRLKPIFGEAIVDTLCAGSSYIFGDRQLTEAGLYTDTLIGRKGCDSLIQLDLRVETLDNMLSFNPKAIQPGCNGEESGSIIIDDISGTDPPFRVYYDGQLIEGSLIPDLTPGEYLLTAYDRNFCSQESIVSIVEPEFVFILDIGEDKIVELGETVTIIIESNVDLESVVWETPPDPDCRECMEVQLIPTESEQYILEATTVDGCTQTDTLNIVVLNESVVHIPNAFSPTSNFTDNQRFAVFGKTAAILNLSNLFIFDKWGNEVFRNPSPIVNNISTGWDGKLNGEFVEAGQYSYSLVVRYINNTEERITGTVQLF